MKKILSLLLCLAITLSFAAPVSARMLKPKDDSSTSSQSSSAKKDTAAKEETTTKKDTAATSSSALTPIQYVSRVEAIRMTVTGDVASFMDIMFSPTTSEATLTKEMGKLTDSMTKAISDIGKLNAPKEFAKASRLFKAAAKEAADWNKLVKKALKSEKQSDLDKVEAASESLTTTLEAAFTEYDRVYDNVM